MYNIRSSRTQRLRRRLICIYMLGCVCARAPARLWTPVLSTHKHTGRRLRCSSQTRARIRCGGIRLRCTRCDTTHSRARTRCEHAAAPKARRASCPKCERRPRCARFDRIVVALVSIVFDAHTPSPRIYVDFKRVSYIRRQFGLACTQQQNRQHSGDIICAMRSLAIFGTLGAHART